MINLNKDNKYTSIINDILSDSEFEKLKYIEHHGISRYNHSLRVSYYSYKISKILKLDYEKTARAGLLHDFFYSDEVPTIKKRLISYFTHPKLAVKNAKKHFNISDIEVDAIESHMFPVCFSIPKYAESWIISSVDKVVAFMEFSKKFGYTVAYATNVYLLFIMNYIK